MLDPARHPNARWLILALGVVAQAATSCFIYGAPTLVPALRSDEHLSLFGASVVISAPAFGLLLTLIAWGAAADRYGERYVIALGTAIAAVMLVVAAQVHGAVALCVALGLAGAGGSSVNAASGRVVMGWFSAGQRGLAMGFRQTAQPLGVAVAALVLPSLAGHHGVGPALLFPAGLCAAVAIAVLILVTDPPRVARVPGEPSPSPYRTSTLWRIHAASAMLVVPQFAVSAFTLAYLVGERHWDPVTAGRMVFWFQLAGAGARVAAGVWSDVVRSRLGPMRQLAVASSALMGFIALGAWSGQWWVIVGFGLGALVTVADNGLAYTAVAELAGSSWTGRALGIQNTGQNVVSVLSVPALAAVIGGGGYGLGFLLAAIPPLLAIPLTPVGRERRHAAAAQAADRVGAE